MLYRHVTHGFAPRPHIFKARPSSEVTYIPRVQTQAEKPHQLIPNISAIQTLRSSTYHQPHGLRPFTRMSLAEARRLPPSNDETTYSRLHVHFCFCNLQHPSRLAFLAVPHLFSFVFSAPLSDHYHPPIPNRRSSITASSHPFLAGYWPVISVKNLRSTRGLPSLSHRSHSPRHQTVTQTYIYATYHHYTAMSVQHLVGTPQWLLVPAKSPNPRTVFEETTQIRVWA